MPAVPDAPPPGASAWLARVGAQIALSDWLTIDQPTIDAFAAATGDRNPIHVDPAFARATPFGATIAHGFLSLSLYSRLRGGAPGAHAENMAGGLLYGGNRVRFMAPVRSGDRVRGRFTLLALEPKGAGWLETVEYGLEIEHGPRPALVAEWLALLFF